MEAMLSRLPPGTQRLPAATHKPEWVTAPLSAIAPPPPTLIHSLTAAPFLSLTNTWHMMKMKSEATRIAQRVTPIMQWLRSTTIVLQQVINALTSVDLLDAMMDQRQEIRTSLFPLPLSTTKNIVPAALESVLYDDVTSPAAYTHKEAGDTRQYMGADLRSILRLCNVTRTAQLPFIWRMVPPLKKYRSRADMEATCQHIANDLHLCSPLPPCIPHAAVAMVMALAFHNKYPHGAGDALNVFLFTDLSSSEESEAVLPTINWDRVLGRGTLTFFADKVC